MPTKIIIDTDPGVDDSMAILLALSSPELELLGLTIVFGNGGVEQLARNALHVLDVAGRPDVPVAIGAGSALIRVYQGRGHRVHGEDGLGNIGLPAPARQPLDIPAAEFIVQTAMKQPGEVTLMGIGPLTNLALALKLEPRLVSAVREVIVMGGSAYARGNASPAAEANILNDPEAARIVFSAGWPLTMVGLDVTQQTIMTPAYLADLAAAGNPRTDFISRIVPYYLDFHRQVPGVEGLYTHDPSAIAYAIDPSLFHTKRMPVFIETEGRCTGETVPDPRRQWLTGPDVTVCLEADADRLLTLFKFRLMA
jgi:purine nucleosidase